MLGKLELDFIALLIVRSETRFAFQHSLVRDLPIGAASKEAMLACETLQLMASKLSALYLSRDRLTAEYEARLL